MLKLWEKKTLPCANALSILQKEAKLDEITSPQRSILDFFKSPTKPEAVGKPKGLLGFFTKSPNHNGSSEKSTVHSQTNGNVVNTVMWKIFEYQR